jgi:hypothetical protein
MAICSQRVYFFDADTGEELSGHCCTGAAEAGIYNSKRYVGTHLGFAVFERGAERMVTAADFPGRRVVAKIWYPGIDGRGHSKWLLLVDRAKGWIGNKEWCRDFSATTNPPHAELPARQQAIIANCKRAIRAIRSRKAA